MKYRRALLLAELSGDVRPTVAALRRVAPELQYLLVVTAPAPSLAALFGSPKEPDETSLQALDRLRVATCAAAARSDVQLAGALDAALLIQLALGQDIDLLAISSRSLRDASLLVEAGKRLALPLLWPAAGALPGPPIERVVCVPLGRAGRTSVAAFLRDHADPSLHVALWAPSPTEPERLASVLEISGIRAAVEVPSSGMASLRGLLSREAPRAEFDLLVLTRIPVALMLGISWATPVLLLPPPSAVTPPLQRNLDMADLVDDAGTLRARVGYEAIVGAPSPAASIRLVFIAKGAVVATALTSSAGEAEITADLQLSALGVSRVGDAASGEVLAGIERRAAVLRPDGRPLILFDCELPDEALRRLPPQASAGAPLLLAVRLRPTRNVRSIRERLRALPLTAHVIDARAVLDEGPAFDVSEVIDPVRLARVAQRLSRAGFTVESILHRGLTEPQAPRLTAAEAIPGNRIEIELDNHKARRWLLDAIASSRHSVRLQVYMAADDDVGRPVEAALAAAGARGVAVHVLVDSLHGLHGSFGAENPLLSRLSKLAGVELRIGRPLNDLPSLTDLKQRDHRKLVVIDERLALVGGRNLSHEYYTGFEEVKATTAMTWRELPWLDAGARIEGPIVATLAASFQDAWTEAGGTSFAITLTPPAGTSTARVVLHRGLHDANTLDTYRELIDGARSHIYVATGFPLVLELQHALLAARARGVRVRVLTGHVAPTHAGRPFAGPWSATRAAATELVHSRLDALAEAGCEVYSFAKRDVPGWDSELGIVHPHVHAKVMSVDGERCTVGSANFDITASYWESELVLLVEDPALARALEEQLGSLLDASTRWDARDSNWQKIASRRAWMSHWPGVLSV